MDAARPVIPDYELIRPIGRGSYGDVWLARGLTGVYRAVKIVWRHRFAAPGPFEREFKGLERFTRMELPEAGQLALLHVGRNEEAGFFYYVMELADDVDTGRAVVPERYSPLTLKEVRERRGRLPPVECIACGVDLARALAGLHGRGLVHRDIKPSNVILVGGRPKLADIGLVASTGDAVTFVGTEGFVPPEGPGRPAADVFALGRVLYELATGLDREEFPRLPAELLQASDHERVFGLNEVILRACDVAADRRYPDAGAMLADLQALQAGQSPPRRRRAAGGIWVGGAVLACVLVAAGLRWRSRPGAGAVPAAAAPKAIAVLPFTNMNEDKEDAFFADGIQEEILTDLANLASLRVISRTSVMPYRDTTKSSAQIARELGVEFILEGSVRRVGKRVRITGQLIRAAQDQHVWAKAYDGDLSDVLVLQTQVATAIADQLKTVLTPAEARRLAAVSLADPAAYELYLRAKHLVELQDDVTAGNPTAEGMLRQATQIDPSFALSWVELASLHAMTFFQNKSRTDERRLAREALDHAVALAPDRAEVEAGLGEYYYYDFADFDAAAQHYQRALALQPSNARVHNLLGLLARRKCQWAEAAAQMRQAHALDPLNRPFAVTLKTTLSMMRAYAEARTVVLGLLAAEPDNLEWKTDVVFYEVNLRLSRQPFLDWYDALTPAQRQTPEISDAVGLLRYDLGYAPEFIRVDEAEPTPVNDPEDEASLRDGLARRTLGQDASALLASSRRQWEERVRADRNAWHDWSNLALTCALQSDRDRAKVALAQVGQLAQTMDPLDRLSVDVECVKILAWLGDRDAAITRLAGLLRRPAPGLHPALLKFSLDWWPLQREPRFQALLADPAIFHPQY